MKAKLINPPSPFLCDERVFPYLGIVSVATKMRDDGHDVEVIDLAGDKNWVQTVRHLPKADMYGVTSTSAQYKYAHQIGQILKGRGKTIIGGTHVNNVPTHDIVNTRDLRVFDTIFKGEGEQYQGVMEAGQYFDGGIVKNLDDIAVPDRSLIDINSYKYKINGQKATILLTQRGCPFTCTFCSGRNNDMYRKSRQHSPKRVAEELQYLHDTFGFKSFMWFDDEVNINPGRLKEIAERVKNKDWTHRGFVRSDLIVSHPESLDYLKRIGFTELAMGVESGSDKVLKTINKGTTRAKNLEAAIMIKDKGFKLKTFGMIGHPGETCEDVLATKDFLLKVKPDAFDIAMMQPYPGSKTYDEAELSNEFKNYPFEFNGLFFNKPRFSKESPFHRGIPGTYNCHVRTHDLTALAITFLRDKIEKEVKRKLNIK